MNEPRTLPINAKVIALKEDMTTWSLVDDFTPEEIAMVDSIEGVFWYDQNEHTYCCEMTPSYYLRHIEYRIVWKDEARDKEGFDELNERGNEFTITAAGGDNQDKYVHIHTIDGIVQKIKRKPFRFASLGLTYWKRVGFDNAMEGIEEYLRSNAVI